MIGNFLTQTKKAVREKWVQEMREMFLCAEEFTLFSLDPVPWEWKPKKEQKSKPTNKFHGYAELGSLEFPRNHERTNVVTSLLEGIAKGSWRSACFQPRHGIHAIRGTNIYDLVICFSCKQVYSYSDSNTNRVFFTTREPEIVFNQVLKTYRIPIAK